MTKSEVVAELPRACSDELAAVEFLEKQRWGDTPKCIHCNSTNVYKMTKGGSDERNERYLWRCHDCHNQYTVRVGTVFEESRLPLRHWCYAFWAACCSKKGVSALQIMRNCQISYKSALFLMHRIRYAMTPAPRSQQGKLSGTCEADETYVGGKPRYKGTSKRGHGTKKTPVFAVVERGGRVRTRVIADVSAASLKSAVRQYVDRQAKVMTDENPAYKGLALEYAGGHHTVCHSAEEYVRGDVTTNTVEGFFALVKRGLIGV